MIEIYTDGSCRNGENKRGANNVGGFGVIVLKDNKVIHSYYHEENNTTNNRQELKAILYALMHFGKY